LPTFAGATVNEEIAPEPGRWADRNRTG